MADVELSPDDLRKIADYLVTLTNETSKTKIEIGVYMPVDIGMPDWPFALMTTRRVRDDGIAVYMLVVGSPR